MRVIINKRIDKFIILVLGTFLGLTFIYNLYLVNRNETDKEINADGLEEFARSYLPGEVNADLGKRLDCSGYTRQVYKKFDVELSANSTKQYVQTARLDTGELRKADLVFFNTNSKGISHVGIYLGNKAFIHSPDRNRPVRIDSIHIGYFAAHYAGGGKILIDSK